MVRIPRRFDSTTRPAWTRHRRSAALAVIVLAGLCATAAAPRPAAAAKPKAAKAAITPPVPSPAPSAPSAPAAPVLPATAAVLQGLRAALAASARAAEQPDLAEILLGSLAEATWVGLVHGHYGLAGTGHALRAGSLPAGDAQTMADDTAKNFQRLATLYAGLAGRKQFDPGLAAVFCDLGHLSSQGDTAARALGRWAVAKDDDAKAQAFDAALDSYRLRLQEVARVLRGP